MNVLLNSVAGQVLIEAKILEISLSKKYHTGIDWKSVGNSVNSLTKKVNGIEVSLGSPVSGKGDFSQIALAGTNLAATAKFIQQFGVTRALSSPRILASNNQQSVMTFAKNHVYFDVKLSEKEK